MPARIDVSPKEITVAKIEQYAVMVANAQKRAALETLLRDEQMQRAIIFTRTKHGANKVCRQLNSSGFVAGGNSRQQNSKAARQRALQNFKHGDAWILVATDIAARGIDIDDVSHVINYELPHEPESYVHRIGRTGRAGATGIAWALIDPAEKSRLRAIERLTKKKLQNLQLDITEIEENAVATEATSKRTSRPDGDNKPRRRNSKANTQKHPQQQRQSRGRAAQARKRAPSTAKNEHNDNSGPATSMRAEAQDSAQQETSKNAKATPADVATNPMGQRRHVAKGKNPGAKHSAQDNDQDGQRPPRRRRRTVA